MSAAEEQLTPASTGRADQCATQDDRGGRWRSPTPIWGWETTKRIHGSRKGLGARNDKPAISFGWQGVRSPYHNKRSRPERSMRTWEPVIQEKGTHLAMHLYESYTILLRCLIVVNALFPYLYWTVQLGNHDQSDSIGKDPHNQGCKADSGWMSQYIRGPTHCHGRSSALACIVISSIHKGQHAQVRDEAWKRMLDHKAQ